MKNIAIFASGKGTNAEHISKYFAGEPGINVAIILTNNPKAFVLERAKRLGIPTLVFDRNTFYKMKEVLQVLMDKHIDLIVLAGFLWLVPGNLIDAFRGKIINIHPALLPKYGGKGMYGNRVHQTVIDNGEKYSGITIHYVDEKYDEGRVVFQKEIPVLEDDTPDTLAARIHKLEYEFYPRVIENLLQEQQNS